MLSPKCKYFQTSFIIIGEKVVRHLYQTGEGCCPLPRFLFGTNCHRQKALNKLVQHGHSVSMLKHTAVQINIKTVQSIKGNCNFMKAQLIKDCWIYVKWSKLYWYCAYSRILDVI